MKLLALADLHLDIPKGPLKVFDLEDAKTAIKSIGEIEAVKNKEVDAVVLAGDIFDSVRTDSVPSELMRLLNEELKDIPHKFAIRGNHDRARFSILQNYCGYTALKPDDCIEIADGVTISGCDFTGVDEHKAYLRDAKSDILVCHFPMGPFSTYDSNIHVTDCPTGKVTIVGDTHKPDVYVGEGVWVVSPGCLFPANKTELLSGYAGNAYVLDVAKEVSFFDSSLRVSISERIPLITRSGHDLSSIESLDELVEGLRSIAMGGPFPGNLMPVAYIPARFSDVTQDGVHLIPVRESVESSGAVVSFDGFVAEGTRERSRKILQKLIGAYGEDTVDLAMTALCSDPDVSLLEEFVRVTRNSLEGCNEADM